MAKKTTPKEPQAPAKLMVLREDAKAKLEDRIQKGRELKQAQITSGNALEAARNEYSKWNSFNVELLNRIFSSDQFANEYSWWGGVFVGRDEPSLGQKIAELHKDIDEKIHRLDSIVERLELIPVSRVAEPPRASERSAAALQTKT